MCDTHDEHLPHRAEWHKLQKAPAHGGKLTTAEARSPMHIIILLPGHPQQPNTICRQKGTEVPRTHQPRPGMGVTLPVYKPGSLPPAPGHSQHLDMRPSIAKKWRYPRENVTCRGPRDSELTFKVSWQFLITTKALLCCTRQATQECSSGRNQTGQR